jgi:DNA invertase Pin-like site-specific DNA recombinase
MTTPGGCFSTRPGTFLPSSGVSPDEDGRAFCAPRQIGKIGHVKRRAILLARVSTSKESQETSIDRQLARLRATAAAREWTIVLELLVDESGRNVIGREDVKQALDLIVRRRADILAVDHLFRLGRNAKEMLEAADIISAAGGAFYEQEREIDTTGPFGRMAFTMLAAVGEFYSRDGSRKIREGLQRARERGVVLGRRRTIDYAQLQRARELRAAAPPASWTEIAEELGGSPGAWSRALSRAV